MKIVERKTSETKEARRIDLIKKLKEVLPQQVVDELGLEQMSLEQISDIITKALRGIGKDTLSENDDDV